MHNQAPTKIQRILVALALVLLRGIRSFLKILGHGGRATIPFVSVLIRVLIRFLVLPIYKLVIRGRIRLSRVLAATHGFVFLIFANRYVLHAAIIIIAVATIGSQLQPANATTPDAQHSLLYALATHGQDEVVEESVRPELLTKNVHYLGADTMQAIPAIDYDYQTDLNNPPADLTLPGSIAAEPGSPAAQPNVPGQQVVERTQTETYTIQSGDTVAAIANRYGVNVGTILWANGLGKNARIKPGMILKIPSVSGVLHQVAKGDTVEKIAKLYGIKPADIYSANHLTPSQRLGVADEIILPGAVPLAPPKPKLTKRAIAVREDVPSTNITNKSYDQYQELTTPPPDTRAKPPDEESVAPTGKLLWPTTSRLINQYYSWFHTGVDIDGDYTNPIFAADDGVVTKAGWNSGGYGLMVMIDHQDGYQTRYGHASKLFVQEGDTVKRGQVIAMIGTTGRSTGTHLHLEVYVNGRRVNPLAYIR